MADKGPALTISGREYCRGKKNVEFYALKRRAVLGGTTHRTTGGVPLGGTGRTLGSCDEQCTSQLDHY